MSKWQTEEAYRGKNTEKREITGLELIDAYKQQNGILERTNASRERQIEYIASIPATREKTIEGGEIIIITRDQELRNIARKEAINIMTKGEFKTKLNIAADMSKKEKGGTALNADELKTLDSAKNRITVMNKFANHPEQEKELKRLLEYSFTRNCTEAGIRATITDNAEKIAGNNELIGKLAGLEGKTFTINIKHEKSLGALRLDDHFNKQLSEAITTTTPAPEKAAGRKRGAKAKEGEQGR
jgi:hypothetical protein